MERHRVAGFSLLSVVGWTPSLRALFLFALLLTAMPCECRGAGAAEADIEQRQRKYREDTARTNQVDENWTTTLGKMEVIKCHKGQQQEFFLLVEESLTPKPGMRMKPINRVVVLREMGRGYGSGGTYQDSWADAQAFVIQWMKDYGYGLGWPGDTDAHELNGRLGTKQEIAPPARMVDVIKELPAAFVEFGPSGGPRSQLFEKYFQRGSAVLSLELQIDNAPQGADTAVAVTFEIDAPSRITGVRRAYMDKGRASTTFVFSPSTVEGQGGVIYARAYYPRSVAKHADYYVASPEQKTATVKIYPLCRYANSVYYADNLISDITYDMDDLKKQFAEAIDKYGKERVDASAYLSLAMFIHMSVQGTAVNRTYFTGHEVKLGQYVMSEGSQTNPVTPGQLFHKALELNGGDMTKALLTCHNLLRAAARGMEDFSDQVPFIRHQTEKLTPKEQNERQDELDLVAQLGRTQAGRDYNTPYTKLFDRLKPLRPGDDNAGAWYHLFGTATASLGSQSNYVMSSDVEIPLNMRPFMRPAICWGEEYLISGDIYSDPNEYCMDVRGLHLGDFLRERLTAEKRVEFERRQNERVNQIKADIEAGIERRLNLGKSWPATLNEYTSDQGPGADRYPVGIGAWCPVTTTITDKKNGRFFRFDQKTFSLDGDLPVRFGFNPDGKYYQMIVYVPRVDLEVRCEALEDKSFSLECIDFATKTCASFEKVSMAAGDTFALNIPRGDVKQEMKNPKGQTFKPTLSTLSPEEEKRLREDACRYVSQRWDHSKGAPSPTDGRQPSQETGVSSKQEKPDQRKPDPDKRGTVLPPPSDSAKASGVWTLEKIKRYEKQADAQAAYPSRWSGEKGEIATEVGALDVAPPGKQVFQFSWTDPPSTLTPGQKIKIALEGRVQVNRTQGRRIGGSIQADIDAVDVMPGFVTKSRRTLSDGRNTEVRFNQDSPEGTVAQLDGEVEVPDVGYAGPDQSGMMQLRVIVTHHSIVAFRYIYRWVPAKSTAGSPVRESEWVTETIESAMTLTVPTEWQKIPADEGNIVKGCAWAKQGKFRFGVELHEAVDFEDAKGPAPKQKKDVRVGGRDATYCVFLSQVNDVDWKMAVLRFKDNQANGRPITVILMAPETAWKDFAPTFNHVLKSMRFSPGLWQNDGK